MFVKFLFCYLTQWEESISSLSSGRCSYFPQATLNWLPYLLRTFSPRSEVLSLTLRRLSAVADSRFCRDLELLILVSIFLMAPPGALLTSCVWACWAHCLCSRSILFLSSLVSQDLTFNTVQSAVRRRKCCQNSFDIFSLNLRVPPANIRELTFERRKLFVGSAFQLLQSFHVCFGTARRDILWTRGAPFSFLQLFLVIFQILPLLGHTLLLVPGSSHALSVSLPLTLCNKISLYVFISESQLRPERSSCVGGSKVVTQARTCPEYWPSWLSLPGSGGSGGGGVSTHYQPPHTTHPHMCDRHPHLSQSIYTAVVTPDDSQCLMLQRSTLYYKCLILENLSSTLVIQYDRMKVANIYTKRCWHNPYYV